MTHEQAHTLVLPEALFFLLFCKCNDSRSEYLKRKQESAYHGSFATFVLSKYSQPTWLWLWLTGKNTLTWTKCKMTLLYCFCMSSYLMTEMRLGFHHLSPSLVGKTSPLGQGSLGSCVATDSFSLQLHISKQGIAFQLVFLESCHLL